MPKRQTTKYTLDFKYAAVNRCLASEISYLDLSLQLGINNSSLITNWVSRFRNEGIDGLSKKKGRPPKMESKDKKVVKPTDDSSNTSEHIKKLEKQVRYLQVENAYLKELRRLRLEKAKKVKRQQESFTASGDHSN